MLLASYLLDSQIFPLTVKTDGPFWQALKSPHLGATDTLLRACHDYRKSMQHTSCRHITLVSVTCLSDLLSWCHPSLSTFHGDWQTNNKIFCRQFITSSSPGYIVSTETSIGWNFLPLVQPCLRLFARIPE